MEKNRNIVLLCGEESADAELEQILTANGYHVVHAASREELTQHMGQKAPILVYPGGLEAIMEDTHREHTIRGLSIDEASKSVIVDGRRVSLTPTEYKILNLLIQRPGEVVSNAEIYSKVWKMEPYGAENTVAVHICHLREKIEDNPQNPKFLKGVWGQGYKVG